MKNRRGYSLVEMLVVISALSVVVLLAVTTVFVMLRTESRAAASLVAETTLARLSSDFRRDVHAARQVNLIAETDTQPARLELSTSNGRTVSYEYQFPTVVRIGRQEGEPVAIENYRVQATRADFIVAEDGQIAALQLQPQDAAANRQATETETEMETENGKRDNNSTIRTQRTYTIEAVIGRDYRFDQQ